MKSILPLIILALHFVSCSKDPQPNDEFRDLIKNLNFQKDTADAFNNILDTLDNRNILFGDFYKYYHYTIQDSCDRIANTKYDDGEYLFREKSEEEHEFLYEITTRAIEEYHRNLAIDKSVLLLVEEKIVLTPDIKRYINQQFDLQMYIPEDNN